LKKKLDFDLSALTLIMPTYNRHEYAERSINFWESKNVNLIILDGSKIPLKRKMTDSIPKNIQYFNVQKGWTERILMGAQLSSTTYTALINDDEFYLPASLANCIEELNKNDELVSVIGNVIKFKKLNKKIFFMRAYTNFNGAKVSEKDPIERVINHLNPYAMTSLFAISRTNVFIKSAMVAHECSHLPFTASFELGFEIANSFQGRSKVLPVLHWLRSTENPPSWNAKPISAENWLEFIETDPLFDTTSKNVQKILTGKPLNVSQTSETILFIGIESYFKNRLGESVMKWKLFRRASRKIARKLIRRTIGLVISESDIYGLINKFLIFSKIRILKNRWVPVSTIINDLYKDGIYVSKDSLQDVLEAIEN